MNETVRVDPRSRVALVTGASRNIGRAIALADDGVDVAVHAVGNRAGIEKTAQLVRASVQRAMVVMGDLTEPDTVGAMVTSVVEELGALDILVHNAASRPEGAIDNLSLAQWRHVMGVSLDALFLLTQAALQHLRTGIDPAIVALGGMSAHTGAKHRPHVIAAKAGLVRALAHDLAPAVTANIVVPGLIDTLREGADPHHHSTRTNLAERRGRPDEVAHAVAYLAGSKARYVTGQTLHVNGGAYLP